MNYDEHKSITKHEKLNLDQESHGRLLNLSQPIFNQIIEITDDNEPNSIIDLKNKFIKQIRYLELALQQEGYSNETILGARYCLCTVIDELIMLTPWGKQSEWTQNSLLVVYHNETWGGEKFFQLLDRLLKNPDKHLDLLELMYYCLILGFKGQYRILSNGDFKLESLCQQILNNLSRIRGGFSPILAEHWQDKPIFQEIKKYPIPLWVFATVVFLLSLIAFIWLRTNLANKSDQIFTDIVEISPPIVENSQPVKLAKKEANKFTRLSQLLLPEIQENLIYVKDEADRSVVVIKGDGLFESGSNIIKSTYIPVISRIADALNGIDGNILITGHSDNSPIQSIKYASNWELSQARADAVKSLLSGRLINKTRVRAEGKGYAEPIANNDTPANKARNRRVEINLLVSPAEQQR